MLFRSHPNNFALARSIAGDQSDNLKGIGGAGLKTVSKRLPFLKEEKNYTIDELFEFCEKQDNSKLKIFSDVLSNKDKIALNYKMMQLYTPNMSPVSAKKIKDTIDDFKPEFHQTEIIKKMIIDGLTDFNWETLFGVFRSISSTTKFFKTS